MNISYKTIFLIFNIIALALINSNAQSFIKKLDVKVFDDEDEYLNPWAGGLNNGQFYAVDLNNDTTKDLVVFDRKDDKLMTFINNGTPNEIDYWYHPEFESNFPPLDNWIVLKDINCDDIPDLFVNDKLDISNGNVKIYTGYYYNNELYFNPFIDTLYFNDVLADTLPVKFMNISPVDIPAIEDINNDGDVDILTFNISGGYIEYFENQSMELFGNCDTFILDFADPCWGQIYESGISPTVNLDTCSAGLWNDNLSERGGLHPGSTLLAVDFTGDDVKELLLGDISFENTVYLENGGTPDDALMISQNINFPDNFPAFYRNFPAHFYLDLNNDGIKDYLSCPNSTSIVENINCAWWYENEGSDNLPYLSFQRKNFLVDEMIDAGTAAQPVFFDYNDDGLEDLIIANDGYFFLDGFTASKRSTLTLFENTGTEQEPEFELISDDYQGLYDSYQFDNIYPAFGDLNGDGIKDMLIGTSTGETHYFVNNASSGQEADFSLQTPNFFDPGQFATPFIFDLDNDGLNDVICGERNGNINFYRNIGTTTVPEFEWFAQDSFTLWGVNVTDVGSSSGYSVPKVGYFFGNQNLVLMVGSESGKIYLYDDIEANVNTAGNFNLVSNNYFPKFEGYRVSPTIKDISGDDQEEIILGTLRGGLSYYSFDSIPVSNNDVTFNININIYPNPSSGIFNINPGIDPDFKVSVFNAEGQLILSEKSDQVDLSDFPSGVYFFKVSSNSGTAILKAIKN